MTTAAGEEDALILMPQQLPKNSVSANSDILALDVLKVKMQLNTKVTRIKIWFLYMSAVCLHFIDCVH